jgi:4-alpha-glucanotransferase
LKELLELAKLYRIQTSYIDMVKQRQDADPEALLLILRAMGAGVEDFADVPAVLKARKEELRKRKVEPVMVAWDGKLGNRRFEYGYHDAEINGQPTFVISAPTQAYSPFTQGKRRWGLFVPVYALHSKRTPYAGDLTDFENCIKWMGSYGGAVAATLPLLAAFLDKPFEPSPYSPASRLFWNEFYVDFTRIPEFSGNAEAKRLAAKLPPRAKYVDYKTVMAWKRRILQELSRTFLSIATPERLHAFSSFVRERHGVDDYAQFRAVTDRLGKGWNEWPVRLRGGKIDAGDYEPDIRDYHLYAQWVIQEQLESLSKKVRDKGQLLYLDLPLGLHSDGYDIWRNREFFVRDVTVGAPPDVLFTTGQNWMVPPMNPVAMRLNRYSYYIAYIRNHLRFGSLLRIDHVMGLHRLFWIPRGLNGDKGVYVEYPAEELYSILSLESHRYQAGIVGENLGVVPRVVNQSMKRHNIAQIYVVQYEIFGEPENPRLRRPPRNSVASLNTHDMPPFRSFYDGSDIDDRVDLGFLDAKGAKTERANRRLQRKVLSRFLGETQYGRIFREITRFLADSMANIVLMNVEDLWGEVLPQNVPATNKERPNWRRRIRPGIEQLRRLADEGKFVSDVFAKRSRPLSV